MKKTLQFLILSALFSASGWAQSNGLFDADRSWIGFSVGSGTNFYSVWNAGAGTFNGSLLASQLKSTDTLQLNAYDIKTWKNTGAGGNITGGTLFWSVYETGSRPTSISFNPITLNFLEDLGSGGDQKWGFSGGTTSILGSAQFIEGQTKDYTFEFYTQVTGVNPANVYDNNNNNPVNYTARFTTVPEPSSASLIALGMAGLAVLRRTRKTA